MAAIAYHEVSLCRKMVTGSQRDNVVVFYIRDIFVHVESKICYTNTVLVFR